MARDNINFDTAQKTHEPDFALIMSIVLLFGLGLVSLYSGSSGFALRFFGRSLYFVQRQLIYALAGLILFLISIWIPFSLLRKNLSFIVIASLLLALLPFFPVIGMSRNGAARWISLGAFTFQPSELIKIVLPLYLAHIFDKKEGKLDDFVNDVLPPLIVTALFAVIVFFQRDFSTSLFIAFIALSIFFLAGVPTMFFVKLIAILAPLTGILVFTGNYRVQRLINYLNPSSDPLGGSYQVNASIKAIASGGIWGKGLGLGKRKIASVPEIHSDFIFSAYCEELGFVGFVFYIAVLIFFAWRVYKVVFHSEQGFQRLLAFGLGSSIILQSLLNLSVVVRLLPATGVPLPFFSAGGSSLVITLAMAGLLVNISAQVQGAKIDRWGQKGE